MYGNIVTHTTSTIYSVWFKIYIIVWKQNLTAHDVNVSDLFKIYIIVWKLQLQCQMEKQFILFKIYVIVWKLQQYIQAFQVSPCLKYTLLYGNGVEIIHEKQLRKWFKIYIIVWKPFSATVFLVTSGFV